MSESTGRWDEALQLLTHVEAAEKEIRRVIIGMEDPIHDLFVALLASGHAMAESRPGLAKTKLMKAMATVSGLTYGRIQGNPGLTPDDIIGQYLPAGDQSAEWRGGLQFFDGPIFNQSVLWDESNRTSPKTQAAFLQGMEEYHIITAYGEQFSLPRPFMVLATQNPKEIIQGTYPLTDANLDRFMLSMGISYPSYQDELRIVAQDDHEPFVEDLHAHLNAEMITALRDMIKEFYPSGYFTRAEDYAVRLCRATRPESNGEMMLTNADGKEHTLGEIMHTGASTRAIKLLVRAARAHAFLAGSRELMGFHVRYVVPRVLRHRLMLRSGRLGFTPEMVIQELIRQVPEVAEGGVADERI